MQNSSLQPSDSGLKSESTEHDTKLKGSFRWIALIEVTIFYAIFLGIDFFLLDGERFQSLEPHPFWIPVILISVQYGTRMGLLAVAVGTLALLVGNMPSRGLEQDLHEWFYSIYKLPLLWSISAVVVGELTQRHISAKRRSKKELLDTLERESKIKESYHSLNASKERLEMRAAGQWLTINKVLKVVKSIDYFDRNQILENSLELVKVVLEPQELSIFIYEHNNLLQKYCSGWNERDKYVQVFKHGSQMYRSIVAERKVLNIADPFDEIILDGQGILAAPLVVPETGELIGMLKIESIPFKKLSRNSINNFCSLSEWIGEVYGRSQKISISDDII